MAHTAQSVDPVVKSQIFQQIELIQNEALTTYDKFCKSNRHRSASQEKGYNKTQLIVALSVCLGKINQLKQEMGDKSRLAVSPVMPISLDGRIAELFIRLDLEKMSHS